jgi:hypothetical protein
MGDPFLDWSLPLLVFPRVSFGVPSYFLDREASSARN